MPVFGSDSSNAALEARVAALEVALGGIDGAVDATPGAITAAVAAEAALRAEGVSAAATARQAEQTARIAADTGLSDRITDERAARLAEEGILNQRLDAAGSVDGQALLETLAQTDADRVAVHADRLAADADAGIAAAAKVAAVAAAEAAGNVKFYDTRALANTALAGLPDLQIVDVYPDESRGGRRARYRKEGGAYVFKLYLPVSAKLYVDSKYGNDANDGLSDATMVRTLARINAMIAGRDDWIVSGGRGSHWMGDVLDTSNSRNVLVTSHGQGTKPLVDASERIFAATGWTYVASRGLWKQAAVFGAPTGTGTPADANSWHAAVYRDRTVGHRTHLARVLNGSPLPDAGYDPWEPQTTTIAVASQTALLDILQAATHDAFACFATGSSTNYEPRGTNQTGYDWYLKLADGSNPNTSGDLFAAVGLRGCAALGPGTDIYGWAFGYNGSKDMFSGAYDARPEAVLPNIRSGQLVECEFEMAVHGPVVGGMNDIRCRFRGSPYRDSYKFDGGLMHNFRPGGIVAGDEASRGYYSIDSTFERGGTAHYSHAGGDYIEHEQSDFIRGTYRDIKTVLAPGGNRKPPRLYGLNGRDIDVIGVLSDALVQDCTFVGRKGGQLALGLCEPGRTTTLVNTTVDANGGRLNLLTAFPGSASTIDPSQYPTLAVTRGSKLIGTIRDPGNTLFYQLNLRVDGASAVSRFDGGTNSDVWLLGTIAAAPGALVECASTSIETLRAAYPGVQAGAETGVRRQAFVRTVTAGDLSYFDLANGAAYSGAPNGDGTATITSDYNLGSAAVGRYVKIVGGGAAGADYVGRVTAWIDGTTIKVTPAPPAAFAAKAIKTARYRVPVFAAGVTATIAADGTQLRVPEGGLFAAGLNLRVGQVRLSSPAYGLRKALSVAGNIVTLDAPCAWMPPYSNVQFNALATVPPLDYYAVLPTVTVSWGWSFIHRRLVGFSPVTSIAKVEGGAIAGTPGYPEIDYEKGVWTPDMTVAVGDVVTLTAEIDIPELRLAA